MVRLVARSFVPVTLNTDRFGKTPADSFFRSLMKRWPQGLWVVTPAGETLSFHYHTPKPGLSQKANAAQWVADTLRMLEEGVAKAGNLPVRAVRAADPFPDRGAGRTRDGGVRLAASAVPFRANGDGKRDGPPAVDSVLLTADDAKALHPPTGEEHAVPADVARKFAPALSPYTDKILVPLPADVQTATMTATVARADDTGEVVRFRLSWAAAWDRDGQGRWPVASRGTGEGLGVWDRKRGEWVELLWVLRGEHRSGPAGRATAAPFAAVAEWARERGE